MAIENVFTITKKRLEAVPTRTIEEVKSEVTKMWRGLPDDYLEELCTPGRAVHFNEEKVHWNH